MGIAGYKDLEVWKRSMQVVSLIYKLTAQFPVEEKFGLVSQMRRCAVSIPSNIAEGKTRGTRKEYRQFLTVAFGSGAELETQLVIAEGLSYSSIEELHHNYEFARRGHENAKCTYRKTRNRAPKT